MDELLRDANVLITGGAGFIGSHLVERLHKVCRVRVLDDLRSGKKENLAGFDVEFIEGSVLDQECVREALKEIDFVFHLAALVSVPESVRDPHGCVAINASGLLNVLEASEDAGVRPGDVKHSVASVEKFRSAGFRPRSSLREGLAETLAFHRELRK